MSAMERLLDFAERTRLIEAEDRAYARISTELAPFMLYERTLPAMRLDAPGESANAEAPLGDTMTEALNALCDDAVRRGVINDTGESRDLFSAKLAGCVTPSPYEVRARFFEKYRRSPEEATKWFYQMCRDADYIKVDRIRKNALPGTLGKGSCFCILFLLCLGHFRSLITFQTAGRNIADVI